MALQLLGILSAIATVFAYYLVTSGKTFPTSKLYLGLNLFGSGTAIVYTFLLFAWASVFVQVFWVVITIKTILDVRQAMRHTYTNGERRAVEMLERYRSETGDFRVKDPA